MVEKSLNKWSQKSSKGTDPEEAVKSVHLKITDQPIILRYKTNRTI